MNKPLLVSVQRTNECLALWAHEGRNAINKSTINRSATNKSTINKSAINTSAINKSTINKSTINKSKKLSTQTSWIHPKND